METITIITPCSREENLPLLYDSIVSPTTINTKVEWIIVQDLERSTLRPLFPTQRWIKLLNIDGGVAGKRQINHALDILAKEGKKSWIYVLDDDNLLHPDFYRIIEQAFSTFPDARAFTFSQELPDGSVRCGNEIQVCHIDQAQYLIHTDLIKDKRYIQQYEADGFFY